MPIWVSHKPCPMDSHFCVLWEQLTMQIGFLCSGQGFVGVGITVRNTAGPSQLGVVPISPHSIAALRATKTHSTLTHSISFAGNATSTAPSTSSSVIPPWCPSFASSLQGCHYTSSITSPPSYPVKREPRSASPHS
ncbi:hypothetical protein EJ110_NYTH04415 [Nymphaea thermarum]|nr:hypothetical protein EJ110_NYTH04415 [Nymphaea thermarum]